MTDTGMTHENAHPTVPWILKPGELVCDWFGVTDPDSRMLLRMFVNLTIYSKITVSLAIMFL